MIGASDDLPQELAGIDDALGFRQQSLGRYVEGLRREAAAMKADRCDIYTDVDGVYTTDPRIVPHARKLDMVTYEEMLELASVGAKVLQTRSVGLAMRYNMPLTVLSSFEDKPGTLIVGDEAIEESDMERNVITGIAHDRNEALVTLVDLPDRPGERNAVFVAAYERTYDGARPDHRGAGAYDIVQLLARAIEDVGADRRAIRDYLATVGGERPSFDGVTGRIAFDTAGDVPQKAVVVGVVRSGRLVTEASQ